MQFYRSVALKALLALALPVLAGCSPWPFGNKDKGDEPPVEKPRASAEKTGTSWYKPTTWFRGDGKDNHEEDNTPPVEVKNAPDPEPTTSYGKGVRLIREAVMETSDDRARSKFKQAKDLLLQAVQESPSDSEVYRWLGDCYYNLLELEDAIQAYVKARQLDPTNYTALRGKGFAHLHLGRELYRQYRVATANKDAKAAEECLAKAHDNFQLALEILRECLKTLPGDSEAMYGRAMACEGASRKLYSNAVVCLGNNDTARANSWAENCRSIIDEGIEAATFRVNDHMKEPNSRVLMGNLFYRRAWLYKKFGQPEQAMIDIKKAIDTQRSILADIDPGNEPAKQALDCYTRDLDAWKAEADKKQQ